MNNQEAESKIKSLIDIVKKCQRLDKLDYIYDLPEKDKPNDIFDNFIGSLWADKLRGDKRYYDKISKMIGISNKYRENFYGYMFY